MPAVDKGRQMPVDIITTTPIVMAGAMAMNADAMEITMQDGSAITAEKEMATKAGTSKGGYPHTGNTITITGGFGGRDTICKTLKGIWIVSR